ncbi:MAG: patatin family protein [Clostridiales bacterium]|nr:patatin family protein [Clostridiales bacterium]
MKVALVLEGGAMRGLYTAGVLDVFMNNNIVVDAVIGVSAGALFGVNYISNQAGRALRYSKKYLNDKRYMGFYSLITTGDIMNKDFCFNELIYKLDRFDFESFKNSKIDFYATVTNLNTGEAEYIKINDLDDGHNLEYLRASGSMPLVSNIVKIDKNEYLDGGIADSIPVKKARKLGYDKIIAVLTRPEGYKKKKSNCFLYNIVYSKYPKFVETVKKRYKNYNNTIDYINSCKREKSIFVIRPTKDLKVKRLEKNIIKVENLYNLGVLDAQKALENLKKYLGLC